MFLLPQVALLQISLSLCHVGLRFVSCCVFQVVHNQHCLVFSVVINVVKCK
jgi:hypothetical protein